MNLKALNLKWALAFAGAAVVGVAGVVLVLTLMRGGDDQATAEPATATVAAQTAEPEGTPVPTRPIPTVYPIHVPTLGPGFTLAEKRSCPDKWQRISDDVLNYSICIPLDWGILDYNTGERSSQLTRHAEDLQILSPEGFPYPVGVPLDKPLQDPGNNLVYMSISTATPNASTTCCEVLPRGFLGSLPAEGCECHFNYLESGDVEYRPDGSLVSARVILPLPDPEPGPLGARTGQGLSITFIGREKAMQAHGETISQILDTVEGQP